MKKETISVIRKTNAYLALVTVLMYIITGYGITRYQLVEKITFGLLNKALSFQIHSYLISPLIIFLLIHLLFACNIFRRQRK
jgi:thiosulfate reductase cytochrome b subunit